MQEKYRDKPGMTYKQMDGRSMELPDANFNVVIDKALGSTAEARKSGLLCLVDSAARLVWIPYSVEKDRRTTRKRS